MTAPNPASKICLKCARQKLAGKTPKPCADCLLLNVDPLAQVRARAAKPSRLLLFTLILSASSLAGGQATKPARATRSGRYL